MHIYKPNSIKNSGIAIAGALAFFVSPNGEKQQQALLDWRSAAGIPWDMLILFGGGFALAVSVWLPLVRGLSPSRERCRVLPPFSEGHDVAADHAHRLVAEQGTQMVKERVIGLLEPKLIEADFNRLVPLVQIEVAMFRGL